MKLKPILCFTGGVLGVIALGVLAFLFVLDKPGGPMHRWQKAETEMGEIQKALNLYSLEHNFYPATLEALKPKYFRNGVPLNPFSKEPYDYMTNGERFFLICYGHDNTRGGIEDRDSDIIFDEHGRLSPYP